MNGERKEPATRSRRMYALWAIALTLLLTAGLFCWLVAVPVMQVRKVLVTGDHVDRKVAAFLHPDALWAPNAAVGQLGGKEQAIRKLSLYLRVPEFLTTRRGRAARALVACGSAAVPRLIRCLDDDHENVRLAAVHGLGSIGDPRGVDALITVLGDRDRNLRVAAIRSLAMIGPDAKKAIPALEGLLCDTDVRTRRDACIALGDIGPSAIKAAPAIEALLQDGDEGIRESAALALEKIRAAEAAGGKQ